MKEVVEDLNLKLKEVVEDLHTFADYLKQNLMMEVEAICYLEKEELEIFEIKFDSSLINLFRIFNLAPMHLNHSK